MFVKNTRNTTLVTIVVYIILSLYVIDNQVAAGTMPKQIKIQIKPLYKELNRKEKIDYQLKNDYHEPINYQEVTKDEISKKLEKTIVEQIQPKTNDYFNIDSLNDSICKNIVKNLEKNHFFVITNNTPNIIVEVSIEKTTVNSLYGARLIADTVSCKGSRNAKVVFNTEFNQNYKNWFSSIKPPEQIGAILAKKIAKEIKKLDR